MKQFYCFSQDYTRGSVFIEPEVYLDSTQLITSSSLVLENNKFRIMRGKRFHDLISINQSTQFVVSKRFRDIWSGCGYHNYFFQIDILDAHQPYYCLIDVPEVGPIINLKKAQFDEEDIQFSLATWSGQKLFNMKGSLWVVCDEEMREVIEKKKITNIVFYPCFGV